MKFQTLQVLPFGEIAISASCPDAGRMSLTIYKVDVRAELPTGMSVDEVDVFFVNVVANSFLTEFELLFQLKSCPPEGGCPNSGQNLDAQSWRIGDGSLTIGTEDGEAIQDRIPWIVFDRDDYPINHLPDGFKIVLKQVPVLSNFSLHFVTAYNRIASTDESEWFAAEIPHQTILDAPPMLIATST